MIKDLKQERLNSGYSLKEASAMVNVSERSLQRYESRPGKTPVDVFVRLHTMYKSKS